MSPDCQSPLHPTIAEKERQGSSDGPWRLQQEPEIPEPSPEPPSHPPQEEPDRQPSEQPPATPPEEPIQEPPSPLQPPDEVPTALAETRGRD